MVVLLPRALLGGGFQDADAAESDDEEEEDAHGVLRPLDADDVNLDLHAPPSGPERWDVLGLGQAMVDFSGMVDDEFLHRLGIQKGTRKVVNHEERGRVLRAMDGCSYKAAAGGSLSNSLVALSRLGSSRSTNYPELRTAWLAVWAATHLVVFTGQNCAVLICISCLSRSKMGLLEL